MKTEDFPLDWGSRLMARQAEFQRATMVLEIGAGDLSRSIALAMRHPDKRFFAVDFRYEEAAQKNVARAAALQNLSFPKLNALDRFFAPNLFDFVFSIAVMEHVAELEQFLAAVHGILKPRGVYCFSQAPFWTSKTGHHFNHNDPAVRKVLDAYEHIRLGPEELRSDLKKRKEVPFDIDECIRKIYFRPDLSRLSPGETKRIISESPFILDAWETRDDADYDELKARAALAVHARRYSLEDFRIEAAFARLVKK